MAVKALSIITIWVAVVLSLCLCITVASTQHVDIEEWDSDSRGQVTKVAQKNVAHKRKS